MSDRDAFRAEPGDDLKTPDEWCKLLGYEVMDPDGWRGSNGRPWTDPISQAEFEARIVTCTLRRVDPRSEFRAAQQERRNHGPSCSKSGSTDEGCTGEGRGRGNTYTAAEVKVLTEKVCKVAAEAGRRIGREEAAAFLDDSAAMWATPDDYPEEWDAHHLIVRNASRVALLNAAKAVRSIPSQAADGAPDATSGVGGHQEVSEGPQVLHKPLPDDGVTYCGWATGSQIIDGCGEVWPCSTVRNQSEAARSPQEPCGCLLGPIHTEADHQDLAKGNTS